MSYEFGRTPDGVCRLREEDGTIGEPGGGPVAARYPRSPHGYNYVIGDCKPDGHNDRIAIFRNEVRRRHHAEISVRKSS